MTSMQRADEWLALLKTSKGAVEGLVYRLGGDAEAWPEEAIF